MILKNVPANSGRIKINHIQVKGAEWQGKYFSDVPLVLTAMPNIGYRFTGWTGDIETDSLTISRILSKSTMLTANFEKDETAIPGIVINELNYNSADEFDPGDWLELYNLSDQAVNISGWRLFDENDSAGFSIPSTTVIAPNDCFVLCQDLAKFSQLFPEVKNTVGDLGFGLNNGGELILLFNGDGDLVDSVSYDDSAPWPVHPDGNGPVLILRDAQLDNSVAQNWMSSNNYGTPGIEDRYLTVPVKAVVEINENVHLYQNYPNPFNSSTTIAYSIPESVYVTLKVYDLSGREIQCLVNEFQEADTYHINFEPGTLISGIYYYHLRAGNSFSEVKRMALIR
jgi:hypothetical protein